MSLAYVNSPGLPGMRPRNLRGEGTVSDAGMWSTSSVVMRGSCRYSLMSLVYSSSIFCGAAAAGAGAGLPFLAWPKAGPETRTTASSAPPIAKRSDIVEILPWDLKVLPFWGARVNWIWAGRSPLERFRDHGGGACRRAGSTTCKNLAKRRVPPVPPGRRANQVLLCEYID